MTEDEIEQLLLIARMVKDHDLSELASRQAHRKKAGDARAEFSDQARAEDAAASADLSYRKDYELPRRVWRERRMYALGHYEARAAAQYETQKKIAAKSFGRALVLDRLAEQIRASSKKSR